MSYFGRWWTFVRERFEPVSHLLMLGVFFSAHVSWVGFHDPAILDLTSAGQLMLLYAGVVAFFLKLRLYDEIKDYQTDLLHNPTRPLARGLLKHRDLYLGIALCILTELVAFLSFGLGAGATYAIALGYSFLMFKEFFIGKWLRPNLTTYAVSHTFVSSLVSCAIFAALTRTHGWLLPLELLAAALCSWCVFNLFEFARKTYSPQEERPNVDTYSKLFGPMGAAGLVIAMVAASFPLVLISIRDLGPDFKGISALIAQGWLIAGQVAVALAYGYDPSLKRAKLFRGVSSAYIVLFYLSITLGLRF